MEEQPWEVDPLHASCRDGRDTSCDSWRQRNTKPNPNILRRISTLNLWLILPWNHQQDNESKRGDHGSHLNLLHLFSQEQKRQKWGPKRRCIIYNLIYPNRQKLHSKHQADNHQSSRNVPRHNPLSILFGHPPILLVQIDRNCMHGQTTHRSHETIVQALYGICLHDVFTAQHEQKLEQCENVDHHDCVSAICGQTWGWEIRLLVNWELGI